jgi:hypothetical protein
MEIQIAKVSEAGRHDEGNLNWHTIASDVDELVEWLNDTTSDAPHADNLITDLMGQDYKFAIKDWWFRTSLG